jgi:hypothetical protein
MPRPNRLKEIEREYQQPLDKLILRLLNELGSIPAVARHLDTTTQTIFLWCQANHVEKRITWHKRDT